MAMQAATPPSALSFPRETFAKLAPAPFLLAHLKPAKAGISSTRPAGRSPSEFRKPTINTGSLTHTSGSAVVRVGDTAVVCGVRPEILTAAHVPRPYDSSTDSSGSGSTEIEELGLLVPNLELSTGCSPAHLPGNPPSTLAQSLSYRILSLLHISRLVSPECLRIQYQEPVADEDIPDEDPRIVTKAYWALYIDILFISLDGNPFDAAWAAVIAALRDVTLPKAWWDPDREMAICSDLPAESRSLQLNNLPIASTFAIFSTASHMKSRAEADAWVFADPDGFEEELCNETVTVVVTGQKGDKASLLRIEKNGGRVIDRQTMRGIVSEAKTRWSDWERVLTIDMK